MQIEVDQIICKATLEAGTKWFDRFDKLTALRPSKGKLTILGKVEGPMGYNLIQEKSLSGTRGP